MLAWDEDRGLLPRRPDVEGVRDPSPGFGPSPLDAPAPRAEDRGDGDRTRDIQLGKLTTPSWPVAAGTG